MTVDYPRVHHEQATCASQLCIRTTEVTRARGTRYAACNIPFGTTCPDSQELLKSVPPSRPNASLQQSTKSLVCVYGCSARLALHGILVVSYPRPQLLAMDSYSPSNIVKAEHNGELL